MDSGWIVAGSSLATIIATGFFNLRAKRIDAEQKLNEHKLTIRSVFVNKKIEAGMDFVGKTTVRINGLLLVTVFFRYLYERKTFNKEYWDAINNARLKQRETNLTNSNSQHLFFDILSLNSEANTVIHEFNNQQAILSEYTKTEGEAEYTEKIDAAARKSHELNEKLIAIYQAMNIHVRKEIAEYDIL